MTPPKNFTRHYKCTEKKLVLKTLYKSRKNLKIKNLSEITGLEIVTLCRILFYQIYKSRTLKISHIKPCKITGQNVYQYNLIDAVEGLKNGK